MSVRTTSKEGAYYNSAPRGDGWKNVVRRFEVNRDRENVNTNFDHDNKYKRREDNTHIPRKYACNCKRGAKGDGGEQGDDLHTRLQTYQRLQLAAGT